MTRREIFSRGFATFSVLAAGVALASSASAQTTYEWLGNSAGGNNQLWEGLTNGNPRWSSEPFPDTTPATDIPGSALGASAATDDIVNIRNNRNPSATPAQQAQNIYLQANAGDVATLQIGGLFNTEAQSVVDGGNWNTILQVRNAGAINIGQLILGRVDSVNPGANPTIDRAGQLFVNVNASAATVGSVISNGGSAANEIIIAEGDGTNGLVLNGNVDVPGTREIGLDVRYQTQSRFVLGGPLDMNLDDVKIGSQGNSNVTGVFDFGAGTGAGSVITANNLQVGRTTGTSNAGNNDNVVAANGTLTIRNGSAVNVVGAAGTNGNADVGNANRGGLATPDQLQVAAQTATGVLNVEVGTFSATNLLALGAMTRNIGTADNVPASNGTLNLNHADSVVNLGRVQFNAPVDGMGNPLPSNQETLSGGMTVGQERVGSGTVNINAGSLNSLGRVYLGGDATSGADSGTVGVLNVNGGSLNIGLSDTTNGGTRIATQAGGGTTQLGSADLQLGRDGTGTMTQTDGTTNIYRGNLVLGTNSAATIASANRDFDGDGTNDGAITVRGFNTDPLGGGTSLAGFNSRNGLNQNLFDDTSLVSPDWEPDLVNIGDYKLTALGQAKLLPNSSRGTLNLSGGTINVGSTQGAEFRLDAGGGQAGDITELLNDLNYANGGGDINISGTGVLNVERNFNMGATVGGAPINTLTLSDNAVLNIGFGGIDGDLAGQASDITVIGGGTDVNINRNLVLNAATNLTFDFGDAGITDFNFDVGNNANLGGAQLFLTNLGGIATDIGDILLIDNVNATNGLFSNWTDNQSVADTPYFFRYALADGGIGLSTTAIPEPSSLAVLAFGCIGLVARRRRHS